MRPQPQKYYERAANYGVAEAQYRLGLLLASDRSNATSLVSAYKWLVLAQESVKGVRGGRARRSKVADAGADCRGRT
jgi:hypothetical protein